MYKIGFSWNEGPDGTGNQLPDATVTYTPPKPAGNTILIMLAIAAAIVLLSQNKN